eukprot:m.255922 g.255922  ORF g.255922 m.255922 type:complete len:421 (+) comp16185_c0_seq12:280-1542(+)
MMLVDSPKLKNIIGSLLLCILGLCTNVPALLFLMLLGGLVSIYCRSESETQSKIGFQSSSCLLMPSCEKSEEPVNSSRRLSVTSALSTLCNLQAEFKLAVRKSSEPSAANCVLSPATIDHPNFNRNERALQLLNDLTEDCQEKVTHIFEKVVARLDYQDMLYCDEACIIRHLKARSWDLVATEHLLRKNLRWRRQTGVESIQLDDEMKEEMRTGKIYMHGYDKYRRPVMYQRPRRQNSKNFAAQVLQVAYLMERCMQTMDMKNGVEEFTLIVDLKGFSVLNRPPMSVTKQILQMFVNRYPKRLGDIFIVDAPMAFSGLWKVARVFIPTAMKNRFHFISNKKGVIHPELAAVFEPSQLEEEYGGTLSSKWDFNRGIVQDYLPFRCIETWIPNQKICHLLVRGAKVVFLRPRQLTFNPHSAY